MTPIDSPVDSKLSESANLNFQVYTKNSNMGQPINNYRFILMLYAMIIIKFCIVSDLIIGFYLRGSGIVGRAA